MNCFLCGYLLDPFDTNCPRCARGGAPVCLVNCKFCQRGNSTKRYACEACDARLPTLLGNLQKFPLKDYQRRITAFHRAGKTNKMIATLAEAVHFYPNDVHTQKALTLTMIRILQESPPNQLLPQCHKDAMELQLMRSEEICRSYGNMTLSRHDFSKAVAILRFSASCHSQSATLHTMLAQAYEGTGETGKAQSAYNMATQLERHERKLQAQMQQAQQSQQSGSGFGIEDGIDVVDLVVSLFG